MQLFKHALLPLALAFCTFSPLASARCAPVPDEATGTVQLIVYNSKGQATSFYIRPGDGGEDVIFEVYDPNEGMTKLLQRFKDNNLKVSANGASDNVIGNEDADQVVECGK